MQNIAAQPIKTRRTSYPGEFDEGYQQALKKMREVEVKGQALMLQPQATHSHKFRPWLVLVLVLLAHVAAIYSLSYQHPAEPTKHIQSAPMLVSLIAPPAPELVPILEPQPEVIPKPVRKLVVKKIRPIETPIQRLVEATTEQPKEEALPEAAPVLAPVAEAKSPPKAPPALVDKIEPPKFGVAYLNNPAPAYPPISRRLGEEGRVLLLVLVSENGTATEVNLEKTSGSERLDQAAINEVKHWQFIPAKKNNQALSAYVLVPIKFSLDS